MHLLVELPPSAGPGLGPAHPFFVDAEHGYVATTGGGWYVPKTGYQAPLTAAEIDATNDGGSHWRVLLRKPHAAFDAVAFSGRFGYAVGERIGRRAADGRQNVSTFLVATRDGGASWTQLPGPFTAKPVPLNTPGANPVALQAFGTTVIAELGGAARRSIDGGRRWTSVSSPAATTIVRFTSASVGYAGASSGCKVGEMLWRTADGGRGWQPVAGTCAALPFTDVEGRGQLVTAAQAVGYQQALHDHSIIRLSLDGGRSWRVVADARTWREAAYVDFTNAEDGFAVSAENSQGFEFDELHVTADGGRTWSKRAEPFAPVSMFGPGPTQVAFAGRSMWAGEPQDGLLWRSRDLGRTWTVSTRPQYIDVQKIVVARSDTPVVTTDAGIFENKHNGAYWVPLHHYSARAAAAMSAAGAYLGHPGSSLSGAAYLFDGARWRLLQPPTLGAGSVSFSNSKDGVVASGQGDGYGRTPIAVTTNGGHSWTTVRVPRGVHRGDHAVLGPGVIVLVESPTLYVSTDTGRHWQRLVVPRTIFDCTAADYSGSIWIACPGPGSGPMVLFRSTDDGRSWTSRRLDSYLTVTPVSAGEAWAVGGRADIVGQQSLWHTTDGGATWKVTAVRVPADKHVPVIACEMPRAMLTPGSQC